MREMDVHGHRIDSGPTVFTMPWVFEELFADAGSDLGEHIDYRPVERLARHAWREGGQLDLFADVERSAEAIAAFSGTSEARRYRAFCNQARRVYTTLAEPFIGSQRPSVASLIKRFGPGGLADLWRIRPFESLWKRLGQSFEDPRLRSLFGRYATYCGSSPLQAPATLMLIAHVEQKGVWQIEGGMQRLADAMARLLEHRGGELHYGTPVSEVDVRAGRASGVRLASGDFLDADVVIANADAAGIRSGTLGPRAQPAVSRTDVGERSLSAVTWSLLAEPVGFDLAHHNVFFPEDYPREFDDIFGQDRLPANPAVYVCAQDRGPGRPRSSDRERLFVIINAPANGDRKRFDASELSSLESAALDLLRDCGLSLTIRSEDRIVTTPADFEARFPGTGGALYGSAAHGWRASFNRPGARSRIKGLYLAGGSVHPGPGVPMVALSGRLAAEAVAADLGLAR